MCKSVLAMSLASIISVGLLVSCRPSSTSSSSSADSTGTSEVGAYKFDKKVSIDFWVKKGTAKYYSNFVKAFNSAYPSITVNVLDSGNYGDIDQKISQGISVGNVPNMALTYPDYVSGYLKDAPNRVLDVTPYMNSAEYGFGHGDPVIEWNGQQVQVNTAADDIIPSYLNDGNNFIIDGKKIEGQYELPLSKSTEMLFVNRNLLTEVAQKSNTTYDVIKQKLATWEGVWEVTEMMKTAMPEKWNGQKASANKGSAPLTYEDDTNFYVTMSQQLGIPYVDSSAADNLPVLFGKPENKQKTVDFLKFMGEKYNSGNFVTGDTIGIAGTYATSLFAKESSGLIITTTAGLSWLNDYDEEGDEDHQFPIDVLSYPSSSKDWVQNEADLPADADPDAVISQGPGVVLFKSGDSDKDLATWLFYKTMTSDFLNAQWVAAGSYAPIRYSVKETEVFKGMFDIPADSKNPLYDANYYPAKKQMYEVIDQYGKQGNLFTTDVFPGSGSVRNEAGSLFTGSLNSEKNTDSDAIGELVDKYYQLAVADSTK